MTSFINFVKYFVNTDSLLFYIMYFIAILENILQSDFICVDFLQAINGINFYPIDNGIWELIEPIKKSTNLALSR